MSLFGRGGQSIADTSLKTLASCRHFKPNRVSDMLYFQLSRVLAVLLLLLAFQQQQNMLNFTILVGNIDQMVCLLLNHPGERKLALEERPISTGRFYLKFSQLLPLCCCLKISGRPQTSSCKCSVM